MGRSYYGIPIHGGSGGYESKFPLMAQALIEGREDVEHATRCMGGALPYQLHIGHIPLYYPELVGSGCTAQHIPLRGSGLPPRSCACRALTLPLEM